MGEGLRESALRREHWAAGQVVKLADDRFWALPPITTDLALACPEVRESALRLAEFDRSITGPIRASGPPPSPDWTDHDMAIRAVALPLLFWNYDLTPEQVVALMPDDPSDRFGLRLAVRLLLVEARPVVLSFVDRAAFSITSPN